LFAAASAWGSLESLADAYWRLVLLQPQMPAQGSGIESLPPADRLAQRFQQNYAQQRDTYHAALYLAVRAARRALAANAVDAQAYAVLGDCYVRLLNSTRERAWQRRMPELIQLRRAQASAALNQAVALKPDLAQAHLNLFGLSQEMGYLDLALKHFRDYMKLAHEAGPPPGVSAEFFHEQEAQFQKTLARMSKAVQDRDASYAKEASGVRVLDRAAMASKMGLAGKALDLLLESNIAAFGPKGMELELELLLNTGQVKSVLEWTGSEQEAMLGASFYRWLRSKALAASGDYLLAEEGCVQLAKASAVGDVDRGQLRQLIAVVIGQAFLEAPTNGPLPFAVRRASFSMEIGGLARSLRKEADATVLRGLLALEEGEVDDADAAFHQALALWNNDTEVGGLDFNGRVVAQTCLEWLK
jgi:tetratricopeptide (TPR) repeat protein